LEKRNIHMTFFFLVLLLVLTLVYYRRSTSIQKYYNQSSQFIAANLSVKTTPLQSFFLNYTDSDVSNEGIIGTFQIPWLQQWWRKRHISVTYRSSSSSSSSSDDEPANLELEFFVRKINDPLAAETVTTTPLSLATDDTLKTLKVEVDDNFSTADYLEIGIRLKYTGIATPIPSPYALYLSVYNSVLQIEGC